MRSLKRLLRNLVLVATLWVWVQYFLYPILVILAIEYGLHREVLKLIWTRIRGAMLELIRKSVSLRS